MSVKTILLSCALACLSMGGASAAEFTQTLKRINDSGQINLGYRVDQTPMSFDSGSRPRGYSVELCERIALSIGNTLGRDNLGVNFLPVTAENRFALIQEGKIDMLCGATTMTLSRAKIVGFTQPTFVTGGALLSRKEAVVDNVAGLVGKRIAVVSNTTTITALIQALDAVGAEAEVVPVAATSDGMNLLQYGKVDAFAADQVVLIGQVIAGGGRELYSLSSELFSFEPFALAIPRGDPDFKLVADSVLSRLYRNGSIIRIYKKWFGSFGEQLPPALQALYQLNAIPE